MPSTVVTKKDVGGGSGAINEFEEKGASGLCMRMEHVFEFKAPPKCFFCTKSTKLATSLRCTHPPVKPKRPSSLTLLSILEYHDPGNSDDGENNNS